MPKRWWSSGPWPRDSSGASDRQLRLPVGFRRTFARFLCGFCAFFRGLSGGFRAIFGGFSGVFRTCFSGVLGLFSALHRALRFPRLGRLFRFVGGGGSCSEHNSGSCQRAAYADGVLIVALMRELRGLDAKTGKELWSVKTDALTRDLQVAGGLAFAHLQDVRSAGRSQPRLEAFDVLQGTSVWRRDLRHADYRSLRPWGGHVSNRRGAMLEGLENLFHRVTLPSPQTAPSWRRDQGS